MMQLFFCDLDGTLVDSNFQMPQKHVQALAMLKEAGWYLVAATGRNPHSIDKVLTDNMPFDEVIFTTGIGIMKWPSREIIYSLTLSDDIIKKSLSLLINYGFDVMVQKPVPHNHHFLYLQKEKIGADAQRRIDLYQHFATPASHKVLQKSEAANIVAIGEPSDRVWLEIVKQLPEATVVRATSPLDGKSMWVEIYPKRAGKVNAARSLASRLNLSLESSVAVGNDYNDVDLMLACGNAYMVDSFERIDDYPSFIPMRSPQQNGFYTVVREVLQ